MHEFWSLDNRVVLSLISIFVGWFLAQGTALIKSLIEIFARKYVLFSELEDIKLRLQEISTSLERSIQIYALGAFDCSIPNQIAHHIYDKYYPEICMSLTRNQRISYQRIYGYVESINLSLHKLSEIFPATEKMRQEILLEDWGELLKGLYFTISEVYALSSYHINNSLNPVIGDSNTSEYKAIMKAIKESEIHIANLVKDARENLSRDDFFQ